MPEKITEIPAEKTWPLRQEVMWPDRPLEFVKLDEDPAGLHFAVEKSGDLVQCPPR